jgi:hypothetical protein
MELHLLRLRRTARRRTHRACHGREETGGEDELGEEASQSTKLCNYWNIKLVLFSKASIFPILLSEAFISNRKGNSVRL